MSWSQRQWPAGGGPRGPRLQLPSEWDSQPQAPLMAVLCMVSPKCRPLGQPLGSLESKVATPVEKVGKGRLWRWPGGCGVVATGKGRQAAGKLEHHPPASAGGGEPAMARAPCLAWASAPWHGARPTRACLPCASAPWHQAVACSHSAASHCASGLSPPSEAWSSWGLLDRLSSLAAGTEYPFGFCFCWWIFSVPLDPGALEEPLSVD